jgi:hypothetical protein
MMLTIGDWSGASKQCSSESFSLSDHFLPKADTAIRQPSIGSWRAAAPDLDHDTVAAASINPEMPSSLGFVPFWSRIAADIVNYRALTAGQDPEIEDTILARPAGNLRCHPILQGS